MKVEILLFNVLLFAVCNAVAQNSEAVFDMEKYTRNSIYSGSTRDRIVDSLRLENGEICVFNHSPMIFFDGYAKILDEYGWDPIIATGQKGYRCYWVIKNNTLYLENVVIWGTTKLNSRNDSFTKDVLMERIESLTGVKVDANGLLAATWMSGGFGCFATNPDEFREGLYSADWDKEYVLILKKGKLEKIRQVKKEYIDVYVAEDYESSF